MRCCRYFLACFFLLSFTVNSNAFILPKDGSTLNATQLMFEWDDIYGADMYSVNIYQGKEENQHPIFSAKLSAIAVLVKHGLEFGKEYSWKFTAFKNGKKIFVSALYHFTIASSRRTDPYFFKQEVIASGKQPDDLILLDYPAMAIDRSGKPVWYLPANDDSLEKYHLRDLKLNAGGTVTYLNNGAFEKTLSGEDVWQGDIKEEYHHELMKLDDGSYAVAGFEYRPGESAAAGSPRFNTVIHYESTGSIRRQWSELWSLKNDPMYRQYAGSNSAGHLNGSAFTADKKRMLISFKNRSDVFVLNISTGLFETSIKKSVGAKADFHQQHGPFLTKNNEVLIYNNNITEGDGKEEKAEVHPSAMIFRYNETKKKFDFVSEFMITSNRHPQGIAGKEGYISETQNGNILICTGGANYAVEMNRSGKKTWECYFYHRSKNDTAWQPYSNYRCRSIASLYPLYYTMRYVGEKNNQYLFELMNNGSDSASFDMRFVRKDYKKVFMFSSVKLAPGASQQFAVYKGWAAGGDINCEIEPASVKADTKIYHYDFSRMK